jgi:hypothetical protein
MKESLEEGLHGSNTVGGRSLTKGRIKSNHGAKEGNSAAKKRNMMWVGPSFDSIWGLRVRGPKERRFGEGDGEPKARWKSLEPLKELGHLRKGPDNSNVINVGGDGEPVEAFWGSLKDRLQTKTEQERAKDASLPSSALGSETFNQSHTIKEMERGGNAVAQVCNAPQWWQLGKGIEAL